MAIKKDTLRGAWYFMGAKNGKRGLKVWVVNYWIKMPCHEKNHNNLRE
jgi:hypothetical protein